MVNDSALFAHLQSAHWDLVQNNTIISVGFIKTPTWKQADSEVLSEY